MRSFKFPLDSHIRHKKSGGIYQIKLTPDKGRLEATSQPAYGYESDDGTVWLRSQTEMEDGRFEFYQMPVEGIAQ